MRSREWYFPIAALVLWTRWTSIVAWPLGDDNGPLSAAENRSAESRSFGSELHGLPPSPADLLRPDGFQFYAYNEKGDMITKRMTAQEIQALIASGGPDRSNTEVQEPQKAEDILTGGKKVMDVVERVQSVLKSAMDKPVTLVSSVPTIPEQANAEWSNILPSILATGDRIDDASVEPLSSAGPTTRLTTRPTTRSTTRSTTTTTPTTTTPTTTTPTTTTPTTTTPTTTTPTTTTPTTTPTTTTPTTRPTTIPATRTTTTSMDLFLSSSGTRDDYLDHQASTSQVYASEKPMIQVPVITAEQKWQTDANEQSIAQSSIFPQSTQIVLLENGSSATDEQSKRPSSTDLGAKHPQSTEPNLLLFTSVTQSPFVSLAEKIVESKPTITATSASTTMMTTSTGTKATYFSDAVTSDTTSPSSSSFPTVAPSSQQSTTPAFLMIGNSSTTESDKIESEQSSSEPLSTELINSLSSVLYQISEGVSSVLPVSNELDPDKEKKKEKEEEGDSIDEDTITTTSVLSTNIGKKPVVDKGTDLYTSVKGEDGKKEASEEEHAERLTGETAKVTETPDKENHFTKRVTEEFVTDGERFTVTPSTIPLMNQDSSSTRAPLFEYSPSEHLRNTSGSVEGPTTVGASISLPAADSDAIAAVDNIIKSVPAQVLPPLVESLVLPDISNASSNLPTKTLASALIAGFPSSLSPSSLSPSSLSPVSSSPFEVPRIEDTATESNDVQPRPTNIVGEETTKTIDSSEESETGIVGVSSTVSSPVNDGSPCSLAESRETTSAVVPTSITGAEILDSVTTAEDYSGVDPTTTTPDIRLTGDKDPEMSTSDAQTVEFPNSTTKAIGQRIQPISEENEESLSSGERREETSPMNEIANSPSSAVVTSAFSILAVSSGSAGESKQPGTTTEPTAGTRDSVSTVTHASLAGDESASVSSALFENTTDSKVDTDSLTNATLDDRLSIRISTEPTSLESTSVSSVQGSSRAPEASHRSTTETLPVEDTESTTFDDKWQLIPLRETVLAFSTKLYETSKRPPTTANVEPDQSRTEATTTTTTTTTESPSVDELVHRYPASTESKPVVPLDGISSKMTSGLDGSSKGTSTDVVEFSRFCNRLAFKFWIAVNEGLSSTRSLAVSPFGIVSLLAMIFLGARGSTSEQMNEILGLDNVATFNPHLVFQNVTDAVSLARQQQGVANAAFARELFADKAKVRKLMPFYKEQAQQFYEGLVAEVNFATISDLARRRTNLLVRKQTGGRIKDFVRSNAIPLRSPLAAISGNVFQTDCNSSAASAIGRDGELYFAVSPDTAPGSAPAGASATATTSASTATPGIALRLRKLVPVPATVWRSNVLAGYEPSLDATGVALGGSASLLSTIFLLPGQQGRIAPGDSLDRLERRLIEGISGGGAWEKLLRVLVPRPGLEIQVPKFAHRSLVNATAALKRMGLEQLFSDRADLKGITGIANRLFLSDILQMNLFGTCGDENIASGRHHVEAYPGTSQSRRLRRSTVGEGDTKLPEEGREYRRPSVEYYRSASLLSNKVTATKATPEKSEERPRLKLDQPFLYFVRHNPTGLILHMGRFNPRFS